MEQTELESFAVQALVPTEKARFARLSSTPLYGYLSLPIKTRCSSVCGQPLSLKISVATAK